jgi:hypothetical protein
VSPQRPDKTRAEEIRRLRQDLDKRTPAEVAKAERGARKSVDRNARDDQEKGSFLGFLFGKG